MPLLLPSRGGLRGGPAVRSAAVPFGSDLFWRPDLRGRARCVSSRYSVQQIDATSLEAYLTVSDRSYRIHGHWQLTRALAPVRLLYRLHWDVRKSA